MKMLGPKEFICSAGSRLTVKLEVLDQWEDIHLALGGQEVSIGNASSRRVHIVLYWNLEVLGLENKLAVLARF